MRDGLARVRERVAALRGADSSGSRDRYVLLPADAGRRRRLAEIGAVVGIVVVVAAFVGATVALRPTSSSSPQPDGPGLPAPTEVVSSAAGSTAPASSPTPSALPGRPTGEPERTGYRPPSPTATDPGGPTTPAPTTRVSAPVPPRTTPPRTTPPASPTASPSPSETASPSPSPTTEPPPGVVGHPFG
jgi:hypothetical protein